MDFRKILKNGTNVAAGDTDVSTGATGALVEGSACLPDTIIAALINILLYEYNLNLF
jgi:hypothetical protein